MYWLLYERSMDVPWEQRISAGQMNKTQCWRSFTCVVCEARHSQPEICCEVTTSIDTSACCRDVIHEA